MNTEFVFKALTGAIALACAGSAFALNLTTYNEADPNTVTVRISGSSAHDKGLETLFRIKATAGAELCSPTQPIDIYRSADGNKRIIYCLAGANSGVAGKKLLIHKQSNGGSGVGVGGLIQSPYLLADGATASVRYLDIATAAAVATNGTTGATASFQDANLHTGVPNTFVASPNAGGLADVGISDEEPERFKSAFNPAVLQSQIDALTKKAISGVIFGVPVTKGIYQHLQAIEFATTSTCNPNNAGYAAVADGEACMPSLARSQVAGLFNGNISDWSQIQSPLTTASGTDVASVSTPSYPALADTGVYIERRTTTSGTQRGAEIQFLSNFCDLPGAQAAVTAVQDPTHVVENSSGGTIPTNLNNHDTAKRGAVGVLTSETVAAAGNGWRFIKIDGAAPTLLNVVKGTYSHFYESTLQYTAATAANASKKAVADAIGANIGNPNVVNDLNTQFVQLFGVAGLVANASDNAAGAPVPPLGAGTGTAGDVLLHPVALTTRAIGVLNACLPPMPPLFGNVQGNATP